MQANLLYEVRAIGSEFTWCNNQDGGNKIYSNIDRCFATIAWLQEYHFVVVDRMERGISDHNPQVLDFVQVNQQKSSPFRFFNVIADHPDFEKILRDNWRCGGHRNKLLRIWLQLNLRELLRK